MIDGQNKPGEDATKDAPQLAAPQPWQTITFITVDPDEARNQERVEVVQRRANTREVSYHPPTSDHNSTISFDTTFETRRINPDDEALIVTLHLSDYLVKRILVNNGSSSNLLCLLLSKK